MWPIQEKVLEKMGFEASPKGLQTSTMAVAAIPHDELLNLNHERIEWLTGPDLQAANWNFIPDAEVPRPAPPTEEELRSKGSTWKVVDDAHPLVRRTESLQSQPYKYRL